MPSNKGLIFKGLLFVLIDSAIWLALRASNSILAGPLGQLKIIGILKKKINFLKSIDNYVSIINLSGVTSKDLYSGKITGDIFYELKEMVTEKTPGQIYKRSLQTKIRTKPPAFKRFFKEEKQDLFNKLHSIPRNVACRKLDDLIIRARLAKTHAYIITELEKEALNIHVASTWIPSVFKSNKQTDVIDKLEEIYKKLKRDHNMSPGDFPRIKRMQEQLQGKDFWKFKKIELNLLNDVDKMLDEDIPKLLASLENSESYTESDSATE
ncbi:unnamed protein product, partial [Meganyctiphanes norvegica]